MGSQIPAFGWLCLVMGMVWAVGQGQDSPCHSPDVNDCMSCAKMSGCAWCADRNYTGPRCDRFDVTSCPHSSKYMKDFLGSENVINRRGRVRRNVRFTLAEDESRMVTTQIQLPQDSSQVLLRVNNRPGVKAEIISNCTYIGSRRQIHNKNRVNCTGLVSGQSMLVEIKVTLTSCSRARDSSSLKLFKRGRRGSLMTIFVQKFCACGCESEAEENSDMCSNRGSLECGSCRCDEGFFGQSCDCDANNANPDACFDPYSTSLVPCHGRGECICGQCSCFPRTDLSDQRFSGRFCECDDYSCSYSDNQICGGHGICQCGDCICEPGYQGVACECPTSAESCLTSNGEICNGVGTCECGRCVCNPQSSFKGPTCEECPTCPGRCQQYKDCALCVGFGTGSLSSEECQEQCISSPSTTFEVRTVVQENDTSNGRLCQFRDDIDNCQFHFVYGSENGRNVVIINELKVCPRQQVGEELEEEVVEEEEDDDDDPWWWP